MHVRKLCWTERAFFPDVSKHFADLLETDTVWKDHGLESGGFAFISSASSKRPASVGSLLLSSYLVYPVMNEQSEKGKGGICKEHGKVCDRQERLGKCARSLMWHFNMYKAGFALLLLLTISLHKLSPWQPLFLRYSNEVIRKWN